MNNLEDILNNLNNMFQSNNNLNVLCLLGYNQVGYLPVNASVTSVLNLDKFDKIASEKELIQTINQFLQLKDSTCLVVRKEKELQDHITLLTREICLAISEVINIPITLDYKDTLMSDVSKNIVAQYVKNYINQPTDKSMYWGQICDIEDKNISINAQLKALRIPNENIDLFSRHIVISNFTIDYFLNYSSKRLQEIITGKRENFELGNVRLSNVPNIQKLYAFYYLLGFNEGLITYHELQSLYLKFDSSTLKII